MKIKSLISLLTVFIFVSCHSGSQNENPANANNTNEKQTTEKVHLYYFYGSHRCPTCNAVEENLKKLMTERFSTQIKEGSIGVSYLNWEESANKVLVEKYQVYSSSLIFVKFNNGKEEATDLTEFAFTYARKESDFFRKSIQDTIQKNL